MVGKNMDNTSPPEADTQEINEHQTTKHASTSSFHIQKNRPRLKSNLKKIYRTEIYLLKSILLVTAVNVSGKTKWKGYTELATNGGPRREQRLYYLESSSPVYEIILMYSLLYKTQCNVRNLKHEKK
jgi:hypothetical protein